MIVSYGRHFISFLVEDRFPSPNSSMGNDSESYAKSDKPVGCCSVIIYKTSGDKCRRILTKTQVMQLMNVDLPFAPFLQGRIIAVLPQSRKRYQPFALERNAQSHPRHKISLSTFLGASWRLINNVGLIFCNQIPLWITWGFKCIVNNMVLTIKIRCLCPSFNSNSQ